MGKGERDSPLRLSICLKILQNWYYYLAILIGSLIISVPLMAAPQTTQINLAQQQSTPETSDPNRIAAEKAEEEAKKLDLKTTPITQVIVKWEEALKYWRLAGDKAKKAKTLWLIAGLYHLRGEYRQSLKYAQQSLSIYEALGDREGKNSALAFISVNYKFLGEYPKAIDSFKQFISLSDHPGALSGALGNMAQIYQDLGETQKTRDTYNQVLAFWQEKGDVLEQAEALQYIGLSYFFLGEVQKSLDTLTQANTLDPEFKRERSQVDLIYALLSNSSCADKLESLKKPSNLDLSGNSANQSETTNNNIENFIQEAQKYRSREILRGEADFLDFLGGLGYQIFGEYQKALEVYQQALQLYRVMGAKPDEAETLTDIADILNLQGKKQEAINTLNQALDIQRQIKIRPKEAETLLTLGDVYQSLGAYPLALTAYNEALSLYQIIGNRDDETNTLNKMGSLHRKQQDYSSALQHYQQALAISRTTGNCNNEARSLDYLGQTYLALGEYAKATSVNNEGISLSRNLDVIEYKLTSEAKILNNLARVEIKQGNHPKALELAQKARELIQESGFRNLEPDALAVTAEAYEALPQPDKAIQTYQEQLSLYRTLGLQPEEAQSLYNLARMQRQSDKLPQALENIQNAIEIVENLRTTLANPDLKTTYFATVQDYYELNIDILMQLHQQNPSQGYDAQAYHISERARARTLIELLNEANADIRQGVDPILLEAEKSLQFQLNAIEKRRVELYTNRESTPTQKSEIDQQRETLLTQYAEIKAKIRVSSPRYAALTQPQPLTLNQVQQQLLDEDTLLLQYSLGKENSYLWLVTSEGMTSYILPKQADIEDTAKAFYNLMRDADYQYDTRGLAVVPSKTPPEAAPKLSQMLFGQIADKLTKKRLLIVADGALQYIPFAAVPLPNSPTLIPLISQYEIISLPSSSSLAAIRQESQKRQKGTKTLAILADPVFSQDDQRIKSHSHAKANTNDLNRTLLDRSSNDLDIGNWERLPGTRQEAEAILSLIPDTERLEAFDFAANFTAATHSDLKQYKIVHYATHGLLNSVNPELSGIVLSMVDAEGNSQNGFLRLNDIFNLDLGAELVVLSACQTGLGKEVKGEGLVGLTRGFMYAGSPRVLVSLWNVSDAATAEMMTRFYRLMLREKLAPSQALRQAQLEMQTQTQWKSPYYWAAFTLQGEWR